MTVKRSGFIHYALDAFLAALAGSLPPIIFLLFMINSGPKVSFPETAEAAIYISLGGIFFLFCICAVIALPLAAALSFFVRLTVVKTLLLGVMFTLGVIVFFDYQLYLSSGDNSGPPAAPYSLFATTIASANELVVMLVMPLLTALICSTTLWYRRIRFWSQIMSRN